MATTLDVCADCRDGYHGRCNSFDCGCIEWSAADPSPTTSREGLRDEYLDDLREHFVNGSGAYTDSALVARLVNEIDRLRAATPSPQPDPVGLDVDRLAEAIASAETDDEVPWAERPRPAQVAAEYDRLTRLSSQEPTPAERQWSTEPVREPTVTIPPEWDADPDVALAPAEPGEAEK